MNDSFDLKGFWQENKKCFAPFSVDKPRAPLSIMFDDHFILHVNPVESTVRYYSDPAYTIEVNARANDRLEKEIGLRCCPEDGISFIKGAFEIIMGSKRIIGEGNTPWLESPVENIDDVKKIIRSALSWDIKKKPIPEAWLEERDKLKKRCGKTLYFTHGMNGPATIACNMIGTTNLCSFMMDEQEVMDEFFAVIAEKYIEYYETVLLLDHMTVNYDGLGINDDNCYIFPPKLYERFCAPFVKKCFDKFAPLPHHKRRQHSDSHMPHLMGILNDLGVNEVNFGPQIHPLDIRKALPKAVICGQVPPFVLRNGTNEDVVSYVKRDFEAVGADGGLVECLAGVIAESTPYQQIRNYMHAVHTITRYGNN